MPLKSDHCLSLTTERHHVREVSSFSLRREVMVARRLYHGEESFNSKRDATID